MVRKKKLPKTYLSLLKRQRVLFTLEHLRNCKLKQISLEVWTSIFFRTFSQRGPCGSVWPLHVAKSLGACNLYGFSHQRCHRRTLSEGAGRKLSLLIRVNCKGELSGNLLPSFKCHPAYLDEKCVFLIKNKIKFTYVEIL